MVEGLGHTEKAGVAAYRERPGGMAWLTIQAKTHLWRGNGLQLQWLQALKATEESTPLSSQAVKALEGLKSLRAYSPVLTWPVLAVHPCHYLLLFLLFWWVPAAYRLKPEELSPYHHHHLSQAMG